MTHRPELLILSGLPASGKSTYAKDWLAADPDGRIRVNYDDLRKGMFGENWVWNRREEEQMKAAARSTVTRAIEAGLSVVVDNTNLSSRVRGSWKQLGQTLYANVIEHEIDTPPSECIRRDRKRITDRVGQAVIDNMALRYGHLDWNCCPCGPDHCTCQKCRGTLPIAIVDLDGTVADCTKRLGYIRQYCTQCNEPWEDSLCRPLVGNCIATGQPHIKSKKDWGAFFREVANDKPITLMRDLLHRLAKDHLIVYVSGRPINDGPTKVGILTEDWLLNNGFPLDRLLLKQEGHAKAEDFKKEMLDFIPRDRVSYVFDDCDGCVGMYRRELPRAMVMQVGSSNHT